MGFLVSGTTGDVDLAREWYGAKGVHIKCFNYPSNLYKEYNLKPKGHTTINIQLGNSADPSNNHIDVLKQLLKYKDYNIKIFTPLSYGNEEHAKEVIKKGKELFGDKFIALTEFMPFEKYLDFLTEIDIAIFAHKRQQAFGNTVTLLGLGKKVYVRKESTLNGVFKEYGLTVYDPENLSLDLIANEIAKNNSEAIRRHFSKEALIKSLKTYLN
jgi:dTDP-N-acetylfucosamine:lipid II N-acetylfucosaminyltransferase